MFVVNVNKNIATISETEQMTSGSSNVYLVSFRFSSEWNELQRVAVFRSGDVTVDVMLDDRNMCFVPWEVMTEYNRSVYFGVYGTRNGGVVLPTIWAATPRILEGVVAGGEAQPPSPTIYQQIVDSLDGWKENKERVEEVYSDVLGIRDEISENISISEESATIAQESAKTAEQYSGKPPKVIDGMWWIWDAESEEYVDSGEKAVLTYDVSYISIYEMHADKDNRPINTLAIISSDVEEEDNAKIFIRTNDDPTGWRYLADLSGLSGAGNMNTSVYDIDGKHEDIFRYTDSKVKAVEKNVVRENILINYDFTNPVNRNGKTEYTGPCQAIDKWKNTVANTTIEVSQNGINIGPGAVLRQYFENSDSFDGKEVTLSAVVDEDLFYLTFVWDKSKSYLESESKDGVLIAYSGRSKYVHIYNQSDITVCAIAAKLELGDTQTLAHQDEDGNWVLNEIPSYAEQYAICEQYSPSTGEFVGSQHSNVDMLDNSHFIGGGSQQGGGQLPINQRSETEKTVRDGTGVYFIDRWVIAQSPATETGVKITLTEDGISFPASAVIQQRIELSDKKFNGKTLTFSVLYNDELITSTFTWNASTDWISLRENTNHIRLMCNGKKGSVQIFHVSTGNEDVVLKAAKLELGPVQTLAHKEGDTWVLNDPPPNYALELAKCQRYQLVINTRKDAYAPAGISRPITNTTNRVLIPIPVTLRTSPDVSFTGEWNIHRFSSASFVKGMTLFRMSDNCVSITVTTDEVDTSTVEPVGELRAYGSTSTIILDANL